MFSKGYLVFGLLAIFTYQVSNAQLVETLDKLNTQVSKSVIGNLADQIRENIRKLEALIGTKFADALKSLRNLPQDIKVIRDKSLDEGIALIHSINEEVLEYTKNETEKAAALGIDISICIGGISEQIDIVTNGLVANLSRCVDEVAENTLNIVNQDIKLSNQIVRNITQLPVKLSKCFISLRPISCVTNLLGDVTTMLKNLPQQIAEIIDEVLSLVRELPTKMSVCASDIGDSAMTQSQQMIEKIGDCVDGIISGNNPTPPSPSTGVL